VKALRLTLPLGVGAGAGNVSPAPKFAGRYRPVKSCPALGKDNAAPSSNLRSSELASNAPPASDITKASCPVGPTRSTSRSSGHECESPSGLTTTYRMGTAGVETVIVDGYGVAGPASLIVIGVGLE
jgi:hypothetical protein